MVFHENNSSSRCAGPLILDPVPVQSVQSSDDWYVSSCRVFNWSYCILVLALKDYITCITTAVRLDFNGTIDLPIGVLTIGAMLRVNNGCSQGKRNGVYDGRSGEGYWRWVWGYSKVQKGCSEVVVDRTELDPFWAPVDTCWKIKLC